MGGSNREIERDTDMEAWNLCEKLVREEDVLVDQGKREEEGERNTTDENGEERGGAREMEIGYENVLVFH